MKLICPTQIISDSSLHNLISLLKPELLRVIGQKGVKGYLQDLVSGEDLATLANRPLR